MRVLKESLRFHLSPSDLKYYPRQKAFIKNLLRYFSLHIPSNMVTLDHISMTYGLELRLPFFDLDLISGVLQSSSNDHFNSGFNKYHLRQAATWLPDKFRWRKTLQRPKSDLGFIYGKDQATYWKDFQKPIHTLNQKQKSLFEKHVSNRDSRAASFWFRVLSLFIFDDIHQ